MLENRIGKRESSVGWIATVDALLLFLLLLLVVTMSTMWALKRSAVAGEKASGQLETLRREHDASLAEIQNLLRETETLIAAANEIAGALTVRAEEADQNGSATQEVEQRTRTLKSQASQLKEMAGRAGLAAADLSGTKKTIEELTRNLKVSKAELERLRQYRQEQIALAKSQQQVTDAELRMAAQRAKDAAKNLEEKQALITAFRAKLEQAMEAIGKSEEQRTRADARAEQEGREASKEKGRADDAEGKYRKLYGEFQELQKKYADLRGREAIHQELLGVGGRLENVAFVMDCSGSMGRAEGSAVWQDAVNIFRTWVKYLPVKKAVLIAFADDVESFPRDGSLIPMTNDGGEPLLLKSLTPSQRPNPAQFDSRQRIKLEKEDALSDNTSLRDFMAAWLETSNVTGATATRRALEQAIANPKVDTIILFTDGQPTEDEPGVPKDQRQYPRTKAERERILKLMRDTNARRSPPVVVNVVALGEFHIFDDGNVDELKPLWEKFAASSDVKRQFRNPMIDFLTTLAAENGGFFCARRPLPPPLVKAKAEDSK